MLSSRTVAFTLAPLALSASVYAANPPADSSIRVSTRPPIEAAAAPAGPGVHTRIDFTVFPASWIERVPAPRITPVGPAVQHVAVAATYAGLAQYPAGFLRGIVSDVYLFETLAFSDRSTGATWSGGRVFIAAGPEIDRVWFRRALHTTIGHAIYERHPEAFDTSAWSAANPPNFAYGQTVYALAPHHPGTRDALPPHSAFLTAHAATSLPADIAEVLGALFCGSDRLWAAAEKDAALAQKLALAVAALNSIDERITRDSLRSLAYASPFERLERITTVTDDGRVHRAVWRAGRDAWTLPDGDTARITRAAALTALRRYPEQLIGSRIDAVFIYGAHDWSTPILDDGILTIPMGGIDPNSRIFGALPLPMRLERFHRGIDFALARDIATQIQLPDEAVWTALNPPNFTYGNISGVFRGPFWQDGSSSLEADYQSVLTAVLTRDPEFLERSRASPQLKAKAVLMTQAVRRFLPSFQPNLQ